MSKISHEEVERIAELAKIALSPEEVDQMSQELSQIVEFVEQLKDVDTSKVEETNQVTGLVDVFRKDEVRPGETDREKLLHNAPEQQDGYIRVRRVLG
ncbi:MAG TPA: Asp-tRNA(Asn)/Glu-tRNA(Gln) amidotransferase subunit GatC [Candidatus Nanoarchaeia archaeon]|nr:Asp-tRNA(Asn)/Glu-tRNA(Gln) amidotransferase subunit GatC [Candidatus Nanoarchaeia archaeon]